MFNYKGKVRIGKYQPGDALRIASPPRFGLSDKHTDRRKCRNEKIVF